MAEVTLGCVEPRIMVLLSLTLQIILSLCGNRRKYISSLWINILVWSTDLMADKVATVALGKLSNAQSDHENGNALWAIWAPMLLLHLGGPDSITAYSLEDNRLWMRHFFGLVVQFSTAVYVVVMSWKISWFSIMSISALVAGFIKYGERTWVLKSVSQDESGDNVPFGNLDGGLNLGNHCTLEDKKSIRVLYIAHKLVKEFKNYMQYYDIGLRDFPKIDSLEVDDINLFWNALEVEMGLMFDTLYTKATMNYGKVGWILHCITFACMVTMLVGLIFRLIFMRENREKWHVIDIAITVTLLVGALALEIYGVIAIYLCSDWAMLWLINHNRVNQVIQLRKKISWLFLPKQYWSKTMGQFDLLDFWLKGTEPYQNLIRRRILGPLLRIDHLKDKFNKYMNKTAAVVPPALFNEIFNFCQRLSISRVYEETLFEWEDLLGEPFECQILDLHISTEVCYNKEKEWDIVSQDVMPPSDSFSLCEENKKLCKSLSHYMMHLLVMHPSLLPIAMSDVLLTDRIRNFKPYTEGALDVKAASLELDVKAN